MFIVFESFSSEFRVLVLEFFEVFSFEFLVSVSSSAKKKQLRTESDDSKFGHFTFKSFHTFEIFWNF